MREVAVHDAEQVPRPLVALGLRAQGGPPARHEERGADPVPGHVADRQREAAVGERAGRGIVEVVAPRLVAVVREAGDVHARGRGGAGGQEALLDLHRDLERVLQPPALLEAGRHHVELAREPFELVARPPLDPRGEVAVGHAIHARRQRTHGTMDHPGEEQCERGAEHDGAQRPDREDREEVPTHGLDGRGVHVDAEEADDRPGSVADRRIARERDPVLVGADVVVGAGARRGAPHRGEAPVVVRLADVRVVRGQHEPPDVLSGWIDEREREDLLEARMRGLHPRTELPRARAYAGSTRTCSRLLRASAACARRRSPARSRP